MRWGHVLLHLLFIERPEKTCRIWKNHYWGKTKQRQEIWFRTKINEPAPGLSLMYKLQIFNRNRNWTSNIGGFSNKYSVTFIILIVLSRYGIIIILIVLSRYEHRECEYVYAECGLTCQLSHLKNPEKPIRKIKQTRRSDREAFGPLNVSAIFFNVSKEIGFLRPRGFPWMHLAASTICLTNKLSVGESRPAIWWAQRIP